MLDKLINNEKFCESMNENARDIISFMLDHEVEFGVICGTDEVVFEPELPPEIKKHIKQVALFVLSNYSFESAYISDSGDTLYFEAGFGADNHASLVAINLSDIVQIIVEEAPIFVNICAGREKPKRKAKSSNKEVATAERSMEKLLSRPENKKFLK